MWTVILDEDYKERKRKEGKDPWAEYERCTK